MIEIVESPCLLEVRGDKPHQIQEALNPAVNHAVSYATRIGRHGLVVTQHGPISYTGARSPAVPYEQIQKQRLTDPASAGSA